MKIRSQLTAILTAGFLGLAVPAVAHAHPGKGEKTVTLDQVPGA